jgi:hypothetical protein
MTVFQGKVDVAGRGLGDIGDLALNPDQGETPLQYRPDLAIQAGNAIYVTLFEGVGWRIRHVRLIGAIYTWMTKNIRISQFVSLPVIQVIL